jgi:protein-L-isoaspartate(D-aspartate) O-methyltransferase
MLEKARLTPTDRVLEIGTGSGYQTALLAELAGEVYSVERVPELAERARRVLTACGYSGILVRVGDGTAGWPRFAPYDAIIGSAAAAEIPAPLIEQLGIGGRLILPVGRMHQDLVLVRRTVRGALEQTTLVPVRFVPMVFDG